MKKLCFETLKENNFEGYLLENAPERLLQFGEGNFLRAFVDYFFDIAMKNAASTARLCFANPSPKGFRIESTSRTVYIRSTFVALKTVLG